MRPCPTPHRDCGGRPRPHSCRGPGLRATDTSARESKNSCRLLEKNKSRTYLNPYAHARGSIFVMDGAPYRTFGLSDAPGTLGLSCSQEGLALAGVPLLRPTEHGFLPRQAAEIARLL